LVAIRSRSKASLRLCPRTSRIWLKTIGAVAGSTVVHLLVGLKYDVKVWRELWPRIMGNAIEACKRANAKLIFFDNVYMYGKVIGPTTEETPFNPCSKKGEIRAQIAITLLAYSDGHQGLHPANCSPTAKPSIAAIRWRYRSEADAQRCRSAAAECGRPDRVWRN
jgi:hypothetical protein